MATSYETMRNRVRSVLFLMSQLCEWLAICILFGMMALIGIDVVARYIFNNPIRGAYELIEIMLASLIFLALPASVRFNSHIKVEFISSFGSSLATKFITIIGTLSSLCVFLILTWQLYKHAQKLQAYGQITNSLEIPLSIIGFLSASCCAICTLILITNLLSIKEIQK